MNVDSARNTPPLWTKSTKMFNFFLPLPLQYSTHTVQCSKHTIQYSQGSRKYPLLVQDSNRQFCLSVLLCVSGSSSAHRQDGPYVYYTKRITWVTCNLFFKSLQFSASGALKTVFLGGSSSAHRQDGPQYIIPKWPATWIFLKLF